MNATSFSHEPQIARYIAHELRTPISAIRGRLEGMLDGIYPADEKHISLTLKTNYLLERPVEDLSLLTLAESRGTYLP